MSTSSGQHFSLRWNNHQSHILSAFDALLQNESLVDCTLVCEDSNVKAHKVVLSACSPYFQKIFTDNPCKHPIIVLKDVHGWEVQCIVDFMYKGETLVPEEQLPSLLQAAESLKVRGLTSSDRESLPQGLVLQAASANGYGARKYSPYDADHHGKSSSNQSSPISLTSHNAQLVGDSHHGNPLQRARSPSIGAGPRRKQARPRRRSGDSIGNSSLDLSSKPVDSPPSFTSGNGTNNNNNNINRKTPTANDEEMDNNAPENLSLKRPSSSPAINLVKTETLIEDRPTSTSSDLMSHSSQHHAPQHQHLNRSNSHCSSNKTSPNNLDHYELAAKSAHFAAAARAAAAVGLRPGAHGEHEARVEALQALNFMAAGGGLPPFTHPGLPPPLGPPPPPSHSVGSGSHTPISSSSHHHPLGLTTPIRSSSETRPSSTPGTPHSSGFSGRSKGQHSAPRGGPPRSWTNDDLTKALENVWNKRMTTSQASRVYGIPYNSLLMYVRGKYGKSLKLDALKQKTPAANDNLNTIGNSRSTPKEKLSSEGKKAGRKSTSSNSTRGHNTSTSSTPFSSSSAFDPYSSIAAQAAAAAAAAQQRGSSPSLPTFPQALFQNIPAFQEHMGLLGMLPQDGSRVRELMQNIQREHQNALANASRNENSSSPETLMKSPVATSMPSVGHESPVTTSVGENLLMMHQGSGQSHLSNPASVSDARSLSRSPFTSEHEDAEDVPMEQEDQEDQSKIEVAEQDVVDEEEGEVQTSEKVDDAEEADEQQKDHDLSKPASSPIEAGTGHSEDNNAQSESEEERLMSQTSTNSSSAATTAPRNEISAV